MVQSHLPQAPRTIVVKRARRSSYLTRTPTCLWPGCRVPLAHDHDAPVCGCHVRPTYRLPHDRGSAQLVLHLLLAAYPDAVDLCAVLRCTSHEVEAPIRRLRRYGHHISGARRGYVYEIDKVAIEPRRGARTVKV